MKKILYLTFYFEPDLCAGSFRNSPLVHELARQAEGKAVIDVITTLPNRYSTFSAEAPAFEDRGNYKVHRIAIPKHQSGMKDQILSFRTYYNAALRLTKGKKYDLVIASSSRLFTAYLGYKVAKALKVPLYLDIRDIFKDTLEDVLRSKLIKAAVLPVLSQIENRVFGYASHINLISGGFRDYFSQYNQAQFTAFSNGIDEIFLNLPTSTPSEKPVRTITYAGNFGEGQGLHKIVPQAAQALGVEYKFLLIGDGGAKQKLLDEIERLRVTNVEILNPVKRDELLRMYAESDFLFMHLNDYDAFKKVLPSKVFELAAYDKPLIAGVAGFANKFVNEHVSNRILFLPCDVLDMVQQLKSYEYKNEERREFKARFQRSTINNEMAESMLSYIK